MVRYQDIEMQLANLDIESGENEELVFADEVGGKQTSMSCVW